MPPKQAKPDIEFAYKSAGPVVSEFLQDDSFLRGLRGPFGSGKSVACCVEIVRRASMQKPNARGLRETKWAVIRNTYSQLKLTTVETWRRWYGDAWGKFTWSAPFKHEIRFNHPSNDGTVVACEVIFLALDQPKDIARLLSLDLTGAWLNEAREMPKSVLDAVTGRVNRFPEQKDGGATWYGVILDTNSPSEDHWWPIISGEVPPPEYMTLEERMMLVKPPDWKFFTQPPAMLERRNENSALTGYDINPARENTHGVTNDYYLKLIQGKHKSWIDVYVRNEYGTLQEGKAVYPTYSDETHRAKAPINYDADSELVAGMDFGRSPAIAVCQQRPGGFWVVLCEIIGVDMALTQFVPMAKRTLASRGYDERRIRWYGDPSGDSRNSEISDHTAFDICRAHGIPLIAPWTNDPTVRIETVTLLLDSMREGKPRLVVDPRCINLVQGFKAGYHYRRLQVSGTEQYEPMPNKNRFSHIHDALQYAMLGAGESRRVVSNLETRTKPTVAKKNDDVFSRMRRPQRIRRGGFQRPL